MTNNNTVNLIPLRKRAEMARKYQASSPDAALAKLRRIASMPLREFFRNHREEYIRFYDLTDGRLTVNSTYSEACSYVNERLRRSFGYYFEHLSGFKSFAACKQASNCSEAVSILAQMISGTADKNGCEYPCHSLFYAARMTLGDYIEAQKLLFADENGKLRYAAPNDCGGPHSMPLAKAVDAVLKTFNAERALLEEYLAGGKAEDILSYNRANGLEAADINTALAELDAKCMKSAADLCELALKPFAVIKDSRGCEKTSALREFNRTEQNGPGSRLRAGRARPWF